jgi:hypothetical protein
MKSLFFEKISNIEKPLANLTKMKKEKTQNSKNLNQKRGVTANTKEI